tara:strand:+ start:3208 stop:3480 length:273 start_codon:yes stop_codon:yes gene_type:complete
MAKATPKVETKKEVKVTPKAESKPHYFPKLLFFFGVLLIALAIVDYLKYFVIPGLVIDVVLLIAGLWILKIALGKGSYNRRKAVLMKYLK